MTWTKSSHSGTSGGECVEVANSAAATHVRDSKAVAGPVLGFAPTVWTAFVGATKATPR